MKKEEEKFNYSDYMNIPDICIAYHMPRSRAARIIEMPNFPKPILLGSRRYWRIPDVLKFFRELSK